MDIDSIAPPMLNARGDSHPIQPPTDDRQCVIQSRARAPLDAPLSRRNCDDAALALVDDDVAFQRPAQDREESIKQSGGNSRRKVAERPDRIIGILGLSQAHLHYIVYEG